MALDGIERINETTISINGFTMDATPEVEAELRKMTTEKRYNYIKELGQK